MIGGSHKPSNYPYGAATESSTDNLTTIDQGGDCLYGKAAATLKVGDAVFLSAQDTWNKSTTPGNYAGLVGIVVGGLQTGGNVIQDDAIILAGLNAALVNEMVIVMVYGVCKSVSDVALVTVNTKVTGGSVTAGRVSTTGAVSGNYVCGTLTAAAGAGVVIKVAVGMVG